LRRLRTNPTNLSVLRLLHLELVLLNVLLQTSLERLVRLHPLGNVGLLHILLYDLHCDLSPVRTGSDLNASVNLGQIVGDLLDDLLLGLLSGLEDAISQ
jgi:hypothetical protein